MANEMGTMENDSYLECNLPKDLQEAIALVKNAETASLKGLLMEELYGDINMSFHCNEISEQCANYLRKKYCAPLT